MERPIVSLCVVFIFCIFTAAQADPTGKENADSRQKTLVIGRVSDKPTKHYKRLKPMVDYAASYMKDLGIEKGSVLMAKDNQQLIQYLKEGKIDWVTETPVSALIFHRKTGAEIILRRWKKGVPDYYTLFFTRRDSGIESIKDLKGKRMAFEDLGSTTAYFVPVAVLKSVGLKLVKLSSPREKPPSDKVGYAFSGGEINLSSWVHKGLADAGAFSNLDWEDDDDTPPVFKKDLKVFYQTKPFPRSLELVRRDLNPKIKKRLREILLKSSDDPKARRVLRSYDKTTRFDEIVGEVRRGLDELSQYLQYLDEELR